MRFGGLLRTSFSDFPGRVATVVYTRGCNFRCPYCQNPDLVDGPAQRHDPSEEEILRHLQRRRGQLDGLVVTGGEPTLQPYLDLENFLARVRSLGYAIKLDTNGSRPAILRRLIAAGLVDMVAIDLKAPLERYPQVVGIDIDPACIRDSLTTILAADIACEIRTTVAAPLVGDQDLQHLDRLLQACEPPASAVCRASDRCDTGEVPWVLQPLRTGRVLDPVFARAALAAEQPDLPTLASTLGLHCSVRATWS